MINNQILKRNVIKKRMSGKSLLYLSKKFNISKSTASLWCRNVALSTKALKLIKQRWIESTKLNRQRGVYINKFNKFQRIKNEQKISKQIIKKISNRDLLIIGVSLYWAEGSKKETGAGFSFINSDPDMVKIMYKWLVDLMYIKKEELIINVAINIIHKNRINKVLNFWSKMLDLPVSSFGKTIFIKTPLKRVYANHNSYYGMLRIKVKKSSWLRRRIIGMINLIKMPA